MEVGGNCLNAAVCLARLGVKATLVCHIGNDQIGEELLEKVKNEGVCIDHVKISEMITGFSYIIVDSTTKSRTVIYHPPLHSLLPEDISPSILDDVGLLLLDAKYPVAALQAVKWSNEKGIKILLDAEVECIGFVEFSDIIASCDYITCSEGFPTKFTQKEDLLAAMSILLEHNAEHKKKEWIVTTLGSFGCVLMMRGEGTHTRVSSFSQLKQNVNKSLHPSTRHLYFSYTVDNREFIIIYCSAHSSPSSQIKDTTGNHSLVNREC